MSFDHLFSSSPVLLDGGLGTTLEDVVGLTIVANSPLWSAQPIAFSANEIVIAHKMFLKAGANIILTSSYQCSAQSFERAGFNDEEARLLMLKSVHLARDAVRQFREERNVSGEPCQQICIALSLGPFGAVLKPTQEFRGYYPPPYGPKEPSDSVEGERVSNSLEEDSDEEKVAINALAQFHFDRLSVFAVDDETWNEIDCIAFETVPLRREVMAIRKAMTWLNEKVLVMRRKPLKPWWISCVFPNGKSPDDNLPGGPGAQLEALLRAAFRPSPRLEVDSLQAPSAFGINCTFVKDLSSLLPILRQYFETLETNERPRPWMVFYANGGSGSYDESTGQWEEQERGMDEEQWAEDVYEVYRNLSDNEGKGLGIILGGCCKTTPADIAHLRSRLQTMRITGG